MTNARRDEAARRAGFTLIELLVVIALVAILAALLYPTFVAARQNSQISRCLSHEKGLYGALMMYVQDWSDRLPNRGFLTYRGPAPDGSPGLYMPYVKNTQILICQKAGSYGYNRGLCGTLGGKAWIPGPLAARADVQKNVDFIGRLLGSIPQNRRVMAFLCGVPDDIVNPSDVPNGWEWEPHDIGTGYAENRMLNRHRGGTTYAFLDGHVRWLKPTGVKYDFPIATLDIDYDGDGDCGSEDFMR